MSCSNFETDLTLYVGGDLPARRCPRIEEHLTTCAECRRLVEELLASQTLLADLREEPLDDAMLSCVRRRVLARLGSTRPRRRLGWAPVWWAPALAAALILVTVFALPRRSKQQPPVTRQHLTARVVAPAAPAPIVRVVRRITPRRRRRQTPGPPTHPSPQPGAPLLVQIVTSDPNIVIYWLLDPQPQGD